MILLHLECEMRQKKKKYDHGKLEHDGTNWKKTYGK